MKIPHGLNRMRSSLLLVAALAAALCVAACGSSSSSSSSTKTTASATVARAAYTACLKQHGVTLPTGFGKGKFKGGKGFSGGTRPTGGFGGGAPGGTGTGSGTPPTGAGGFGGGKPGKGGFAAGGFAGGNSKNAKAFKDCASKLPKGEKGAFAGGFRGGAGGKGFRAGATGHTPTISTTVLDKFVACLRSNGDKAMPEPEKNSKTGTYFPVSAERTAAYKKALPKCVSIVQKAAGAGAGASSTTSSS